MKAKYKVGDEIIGVEGTAWANLRTMIIGIQEDRYELRTVPSSWNSQQSIKNIDKYTRKVTKLQKILS
jgi:hypothetical protein